MSDLCVKRGPSIAIGAKNSVDGLEGIGTSRLGHRIGYLTAAVSVDELATSREVLVDSFPGIAGTDDVQCKGVVSSERAPGADHRSTLTQAAEHPVLRLDDVKQAIQIALQVRPVESAARRLRIEDIGLFAGARACDVD